MKRSLRLSTICGALTPCDSFADVGCDHGYCTLYMIENGLCRTACISDISAPSLAKAEKLLLRYIQEGRVTSVCCAGLALVPRETEQVLIAGMGGEEMLAILREGFLPPVLVLQPMKNAEKVRAFLLENGYAPDLDVTFYDSKFYHLLRARRGAGRQYSERDVAFGYDNLRAPTQDFVRYLRAELEKCARRLEGGDIPALRARQTQLSEVLHEIERGV